MNVLNKEMMKKMAELQSELQAEIERAHTTLAIYDEKESLYRSTNVEVLLAQRSCLDLPLFSLSGFLSCARTFSPLNLSKEDATEYYSALSKANAAFQEGSTLSRALLALSEKIRSKLKVQEKHHA